MFNGDSLSGPGALYGPLRLRSQRPLPTVRRTIVHVECALIALLFLCASTTFSQSFAISGDHFVMNGKPFRIFSGSIHYCRIPQEYWKDRLLKAKAMGLNTICTYVFWDLHEPTPGHFDFTGNLDLARYVRLAQKVGLNVIIRPGPYVCSEWDFGGLPSWLLAERSIKVRCSDRRYMKAVVRYIGRLGKELGGLQVTKGGPIILVQLENEYGSYGNDKEYLNDLKAILRRAGFNVPLYTSDGGAHHLLEAGTLPDVLPVVNFGGDPRGAFEVLEKFRPGIPQMCGEYWCGWFTHWGDKDFGRSDADKDSASISWMLEAGKSFNLYMFDGGTNFGWMAGANLGSRYEPDITSYDYDAPLDENGNPTKKYFIFRKLLSKYQPEGKSLPAVPDAQLGIQIPEIRINSVVSLFSNLPAPRHIVQPEPMEDLGQNYGFILYRTKLIGPKSGRLVMTELHDYGLVYVDGKFVGTVDRLKNENSIELPANDHPHPTLDILVEAMGRVNFGQDLIDRKGITERVTLQGVTLMNWEAYSLPMNPHVVQNLHGTKNDSSNSPRFFKGAFVLKTTGNTYLDLTAWNKGVVWVNGHNLGRYWKIGPLRKLFVPGSWLKRGRNELIVLDLFSKEPAPLKAVDRLDK